MHRLERLRSVEAAGERLAGIQTRSLARAPRLRRELRRLTRAHPRAIEHRVERRAQAPQGDPRRARLRSTSLRQTTLRIGARAVRLRIRVPK
jgi:hypothetical protein